MLIILTQNKYNFINVNIFKSFVKEKIKISTSPKNAILPPHENSNQYTS